MPDIRQIIHVEPFVYTSMASHFGQGYHMVITGSGKILPNGAYEELEDKMRLIGTGKLSTDTAFFGFCIGACYAIVRASSFRDWMGRPGYYRTALVFDTKELLQTDCGLPTWTLNTLPFLSHDDAVNIVKESGGNNKGAIAIKPKKLAMPEWLGWADHSDLSWLNPLMAASEVLAEGGKIDVCLTGDAYSFFLHLMRLLPRAHRMRHSFSTVASDDVPVPLDCCFVPHCDAKMKDRVLISSTAMPVREEYRKIVELMSSRSKQGSQSLEDFLELQQQRINSSKASLKDYWKSIAEIDRCWREIKSEWQALPVEQLFKAIMFVHKWDFEALDTWLATDFLSWCAIDAVKTDQLIRLIGGAAEPSLHERIKTLFVEGFFGRVLSDGPGFLFDDLKDTPEIRSILIEHILTSGSSLPVREAGDIDRYYRSAGEGDVGLLANKCFEQHPVYALQSHSWRKAYEISAGNFSSYDHQRILKLVRDLNNFDITRWAFSRRELLLHTLPTDSRMTGFPWRGTRVSEFLQRINCADNKVIDYFLNWPRSDEAGRRVLQRHLLLSGLPVKTSEYHWSLLVDASQGPVDERDLAVMFGNWAKRYDTRWGIDQKAWVNDYAHRFGISRQNACKFLIKQVAAHGEFGWHLKKLATESSPRIKIEGESPFAQLMSWPFGRKFIAVFSSLLLFSVIVIGAFEYRKDIKLFFIHSWSLVANHESRSEGVFHGIPNDLDTGSPSVAESGRAVEVDQEPSSGSLAQNAMSPEVDRKVFPHETGAEELDSIEKRIESKPSKLEKLIAQYQADVKKHGQDRLIKYGGDDWSRAENHHQQSLKDASSIQSRENHAVNALEILAGVVSKIDQQTIAVTSQPTVEEAIPDVDGASPASIDPGIGHPDRINQTVHE